MWVLLMIIFSQPYEVANIDILGTYSQKEMCTNEIERAVEIGTPTPTAFGCVLITKSNSKDRHASYN
tara:strand:- start:250 stop:450 length:201 start_codon:yes stop_codon:yes gene_type:complete